MTEFRDLLEHSEEKVFTAEFPSIDGGGMAQVQRWVNRFSPWFTALNATDNTSAHAHSSNVSVAIAMKMFGLEPIMQIVCRDKNRIAIESDMAGANLHGIENISLLTGDDVTAGDEPEARRVFDLDGPQAIKVASVLNNGTYLSGRKFNPPTNFFIGAVENPYAPPLEYRIERAAKKQRAGAQFLQLQIGHHPERLENFCTGVAKTAPGLSLFPSIILVKSARVLRHMNADIPGITIAEEVMRMVENSPDQTETAYQWALAQSEHALSLPAVRGLHIIDFGHDDALVRLMTDLGVKAK
jgi:methylenetetrahydrofolate reductase (NADPH)